MLLLIGAALAILFLILLWSAWGAERSMNRALGQYRPIEYLGPVRGQTPPRS
jgi:hypothetical protein